MTGGSRLLPLFLVALFLGALAGALATLAGPGAYLPRLLGLGGAVAFLAFLYRGRREVYFLLVRARRVAEPGPSTTWLLVAGILLIGSLVLARSPIRFDATRRGLNSVTGATRAVLSASQEPLHLIGVFRETSAQRARAADLLDTYRSGSSRVRIELLDPDRRPDRARDLGITRTGTILVQSAEVREEVSELTENSITQAILRAENPRRFRLLFATGHGERRTGDGGPDGLGKLTAALRQSGYESGEIRLIEEEIAADVAVVAVVGPRRPFLPVEIEKLRRYLDGGGRMMVCLEPGRETGLEGLLEARGILLDSLEVYDEGPATRGLGYGPRVVVVADYAKGHPIAQGVTGYAILPGARQVRLARNAIWGINAEPLFQSGPYARLVALRADAPAQAATDRAARSLAVVEEWEVPGTAQARPGEPAPEKPFARLLVVGDSDWMSGGFLDLFSNGDLAARSFHWLARREFLLRIPPVDRRGTPLRVSLAGLRTLFYLLQVGLPLLLLGVGLWLWSRRR